MATTVTPGSTAPLLSATVPLICAVACAHAVVAASRRRITPTRVPHVRFIQFLLERRFTKRRKKNECWSNYPDESARSIHPLSRRAVPWLPYSHREVGH